MRATINRLFNFSSTLSGSRPAFSNTPGRKGSITTSTFATIFLISARPAGDLRFTHIEVLRRVSGRWTGLQVRGRGGGLLRHSLRGACRRRALNAIRRYPYSFIWASKLRVTWSESCEFEDADVRQRGRLVCCCHGEVAVGYDVLLGTIEVMQVKRD